MSLIYESTETTIDARGPRFSALLTTIVLGVALATTNAWLLILQSAIFAIGAFKGPQHTPYAFIFKKLVKPKLKSEAELEDVRPPQFAQRVGFGFTVVAIFGAIFLPELATIAVSFALAAAFLNAAFNFCLGCEIYLRIARFRAKSAAQ
jgi:hypothetical protein